MKKSLLLALFAAFSSAVFSQQMYRVLAENGLKLRAAPNKTARVLAVAPFLSEVEVLTVSVLDGGRDTVRPFSKWQDTIGVLYIPLRDDSLIAVPHSGFWLECRFRKQRGFMFSGFLEKIERGSEWRNSHKELSNDFRIRQIGGNVCATNDPEFSKKWKWSGLFKKGDQFELRSVHPTYAVWDFRDTSGGSGEIFDYQTMFLTTDKEPPIYVIGTKKSWPKRVFEGALIGLDATPNTTENQYQPPATYSEKARNAGLEAAEFSFGDYKKYRWAQKTSDGQLKQILFFGNPEYPQGMFAESIQWIGDLDGDGKLDFIFGCSGGYEGGATVLFLSSLAKKGETIGAAAVLWWWYCC